ncbi:hypothetical protein ABEY52_26810 [Priestia aryabhattai]|uniref:hypothetical protein n=1 Tax=Priestia aryabhattai TaxID=412384 RepID=UPI003D2E3838
MSSQEKRERYLDFLDKSALDLDEYLDKLYNSKNHERDTTWKTEFQHYKHLAYRDIVKFYKNWKAIIGLISPLPLIYLAFRQGTQLGLVSLIATMGIGLFLLGKFSVNLWIKNQMSNPDKEDYFRYDILKELRFAEHKATKTLVVPKHSFRFKDLHSLTEGIVKENKEMQKEGEKKIEETIDKAIEKYDKTVAKKRETIYQSYGLLDLIYKLTIEKSRLMAEERLNLESLYFIGDYKIYVDEGPFLKVWKKSRDAKVLADIISKNDSQYKERAIIKILGSENSGETDTKFLAFKYDFEGNKPFIVEIDIVNELRFLLSSDDENAIIDSIKYRLYQSLEFLISGILFQETQEVGLKEG